MTTNPCKGYEVFTSCSRIEEVFFVLGVRHIVRKCCIYVRAVLELFIRRCKVAPEVRVCSGALCRARFKTAVRRKTACGFYRHGRHGKEGGG